MTLAPRSLALALTTCPLGQACTPVVYEIASAGEPYPSDDDDDDDEQPTTSAPDPVTDGDPDDTEPLPPGCDEDPHEGDCVGPGPPCRTAADCDFGGCIAGFCDEPACTQPDDCPDPGPCKLADCAPGGRCLVFPTQDGQPCEDGDLCTKDVCMQGECVATSTLECDELDDLCRDATCNPATGHCAIEWTHEGEPCEASDCGPPGLCQAGECHQPQPQPPLLRTDFSLAGDWQATPPWQLGPALASACGDFSDPAQDHSPSGDDHVAGAAIGGCLPVDAFPEACLTSPILPGGDSMAPLELRFWSVLHSAGAPMQSRIDALHFESKAWVPVLVIDEPVAESGWTEHVVDLSKFQGPSVRVRFCHASSGKSGPVGGWSIDDLSIGPPPCDFF